MNSLRIAKKYSSISRWVIACGALFWLSFFLPPLALGEQRIRIGLLLPKEGSGTSSRLPYLRGAEMAVAEVNSKEGRQGVQILLILQEGSYAAEKDLKALRELMVEKRLQFLMGAIPKTAILPVSRLARLHGVPFLVFPIEFMEAPSTGEEPANLFWISPAPEAFQRAAVRTVAQFPQKRYFLIARDSAVARSWVKYFWEELKRLKPEAQGVGEFFLSGKVENYQPFLQAVLSANAEVCLSHLGSKDWISFVKTANKYGYFRKITHFELECGDLPSLLALKKDIPEGVWGTSAFPFWSLGWKETQEFVNKYRSINKAYAGLDALSAFISIHAIVAAVKKAGSLDSEKIIANLQGLTLPTPVGSLTIRKSDNRALWPIWCGTRKFISDYPFAVLGNLKAFGPDSFSP